MSLSRHYLSLNWWLHQHGCIPPPLGQGPGEPARLPCFLLPGIHPESGSPFLLILAFWKFSSELLISHRLFPLPCPWSSWQFLSPPGTWLGPPGLSNCWNMLASLCLFILPKLGQIISPGDLICFSNCRITTCVEKTPRQRPRVLDYFLTQHASPGESTLLPWANVLSPFPQPQRHYQSW